MSPWFSAARRLKQAESGGSSPGKGEPGEGAAATAEGEGAAVTAEGAAPAGSGAEGEGWRRSVEKIIGGPMGDEALYRQALTHPSYVNELPDAGDTAHNERLEFLGDAVLGLVVAQELHRQHPDRPEGDLSRMRASLICEKTLSQLARRLGLGELMLLGYGEDRSGGRERPALLADAAEALIGALHLDAGLEAAEQFILHNLRREFELAARGRLIQDFKTELQERVQLQSGVDPVYRIVAEEGPPHNKVFTAEAAVLGRVLGRGTGTSKKEAEQAAAAAAIEDLNGAGG